MTSMRIAMTSPGSDAPAAGTPSQPQTPSTARAAAAATVPASRVDRLLRERIRKSRSAQALDHLEEWDMWEGQDLVPLDRVEPSGGRLIVVANRLPVTCSKDAAGKWKLQISAGGLVSALMGVNNYSTLWIGWPGIYVKRGRDRDALAAMLKREGYLPVWLESGLLDLYYNGFCNSVLWQLFHYVPLQLDGWQRLGEHQTLQMQWGAYQQANDRFGEVVLHCYQPGDMVWVQDYHLMLLPSILKNAVPRIKVGWFLHTPFPSSEIYRTLPVREEVLRATLRADLIGFHTYDYARHFISSCTRILGLEGTPEGVEDNGSVARVAAFPIGIDPERFAQALETQEVQMNIAKLLNRYAGRKVMLGVDRLDMIKGIPQKLLAFEKFLHEHPEWRDKVLLVQIAVPSRTDVPEYQKLRSMVHEIVGRINGAFGTLTYVPIHHLDRQLSFHELCALYAVTDVALITSLRDGMNLVSYEYVACQADNAGVLVLSEFAGAAQSLGAGSILVNPWNINDVAAAIEDALTMSEEERRERHRQNFMHVATHTAQTWADTFISELNDTHIEADLRLRHTPPELEVAEVVRGYGDSTRRLIVLGYNATLTTAVEAPRQPKRHFDQIKALTRVNPRILRCLEELCADPANEVLIFSGSEMAKLEETFGELPVWLAAENGVYVRPPKNTDLPQEWRCLFDTLPKEWMESVQLVLDYFCERTPRSFVEVRDTSLVWNYKHADVEFGRLQARDLLQHLWTGPISNAPVEIIQGGRSVEVRPVGVTKGLAMQRIMGYMAHIMGRQAVLFDFVLCIGHLLARDENMYLLFEGHKLEGVSRADLRAALQQASNHSAAAAAAVAASAAAAAAGASGSGGASRTAAAAAAAVGSGGSVAFGPEVLQQQYPLHAICELDEAGLAAAHSPVTAGASVSAWLGGAAAAAAGADSHPPGGRKAIGVGTHRLFSSSSSTSSGGLAAAAAAAAEAVEAEMGQTSVAAGAAGSSSSSVRADRVQQDPTGSGSSTKDLVQSNSSSNAGADSSSISNSSSSIVAALGLPPRSPTYPLEEAAAKQQDSSTAGVYAAAKTRRNQRQQQHHQQQQQAGAAANSSSSSGSTGLEGVLQERELSFSGQLQQQQQQQLQELVSQQAQLQQQQQQSRAMSPPLQQLYNQQQQVQAQQAQLQHAQQQASDGAAANAAAAAAAAAANAAASGSSAAAAESPRVRHKRNSSGGGGSGGSSRELGIGNGLGGSGGSSSGNNGTAFTTKGLLQFPPKFLFTCSVGRSRSKARYSLSGSNDVGGLLESVMWPGRGDGVSSLGGSHSADEQGVDLNRERDGASFSGGLGGDSSIGGVSSGAASSSAGGGGPNATAAAAAGGSSSGGCSGSDAILRAIEAVSAMHEQQRSHQIQMQQIQHPVLGHCPAQRHSGGSSTPGFISQGSLQGFAAGDSLIGSVLGGRSSSGGHSAVSAGGSAAGEEQRDLQQQQQHVLTQPQQLLGADGFASQRQHLLLLRQQHAAAQAQLQRRRRAASDEGQAADEETGGLSWHAQH